jgi:hypothetical protein
MQNGYADVGINKVAERFYHLKATLIFPIWKHMSYLRTSLLGVSSRRNSMNPRPVDRAINVRHAGEVTRRPHRPLRDGIATRRKASGKS